MDMSIIAGARLRERPFEYAANGVTVVLKAGRGVGATGQVDGDNSGKIYTAVNESQLRAIINEGDANTDLTGFCTTLVTNMEGTQPDLEVIPFINVDSNQNISSWDVSNVTDMKNMFNRATSFNQPLNNWDVSNVTNMNFMFAIAEAFNQDISNWCVTNIASEPNQFDTGADAWVLSNSRPVWGTCP